MSIRVWVRVNYFLKYEVYQLIIKLKYSKPSRNIQFRSTIFTQIEVSYVGKKRDFFHFEF